MNKNIVKKVIVVFIILFFGSGLKACDLIEFDSNINYSEVIDEHVDETSDLKTIKAKYDALVKEKNKLEKQIQNMKSNNETVQTSIENIQQKIKLIDKDIEKTYVLFSELENKIIKSSVMISQMSFVVDGWWIFQQDIYVGGSLGSGFIFKKTSTHYYILTNHHVIEKYMSSSKQKIYVYDYELNEYEGTVICSSEAYDMAVVRIPILYSNVALSTVKLAYNNPNEGSNVIAVGNPHGQLNSISIGKVSSYAIPNTSSSTTKITYSMIRHNAWIDSGSSGGMLLNEYLEVVGINTLGGIFNNYENHVGYSSPVSKIKEFLNKNSITI